MSNSTGSRNTASGQALEFDFYSIWRDISRQWVSVILITLSTFVLAYVLLMQFHPLGYTTSATMVVTNIPDSEASSSVSGSEVYDTLYYASQSAESLTKILGSSSLQNKVAKDVGLAEFTGSASAQTVGDSNLVEITVTTDSPRLSFLEMQSVLANYEDFSGDLMGGTELTVLEEPKVAEEPASPYQNLKYAIVSALAVFVLLILGVALRSAMLDTVRSSREVESKLDTRLLATIHHEEKHRRRGLKTSILITDPGTSFRYVETMKRLANRIMNEMKSGNQKILLITSTTENEGKSTVAANVALAIAQNGQRVLLADLDFHKPSQYKMLNMQQEKFLRLSEALRKTDLIREGDLAVRVPKSDLWCVLNETAVPQATERYMGRIRLLLKRYAAQFDFIIVDSAPMSLTSDAEELAPEADTSLVVVRQHVAEAGEINDAIDALGGSKRVLGCVFNDSREGGFGPAAGGYGYGYGSKYGYGSPLKRETAGDGK